MRTIRAYAKHYWDKFCFKLAWKLPHRLVMWCNLRVLTELDPDAATRVGRPIEIVDQWSRHHKIY